MSIQPLPLIYAPNDIFKKKAIPVEVVDDELRGIVDRMIKTLSSEQAVGIGANMVGILKRIAIAQEKHEGAPLILINPEILWKSKETQTFEEASLCFPGISSEITRPRAIKISYLDYEGTKQETEAEGFLATIIQHEIDYLDGRVFLDYLSKLKRDMLMKKMQKHMAMYPPHIHTPHCKH